MNAGSLLSLLIEIDRAMANGKISAARAMMTEAEDAVLDLEHEAIELRVRNQALQAQVQRLTEAGSRAPRQTAGRGGYLAKILGLRDRTDGDRP